MSRYTRPTSGTSRADHDIHLCPHTKKLLLLCGESAALSGEFVEGLCVCVCLPMFPKGTVPLFAMHLFLEQYYPKRLCFCTIIITQPC